MFAKIGDLTSSIISSEKNLPLLEQVGQTWFKPKLGLQSLEASYIGEDLRAFNYGVRG